MHGTDLTHELQTRAATGIGITLLRRNISHGLGGALQPRSYEPNILYCIMLFASPFDCVPGMAYNGRSQSFSNVGGGVGYGILLLT